MSTTLVLTGSIEAKAVNTELRDPKTRAKEYARAIRFYLNETDLPIHFAENSEHDLEGDEMLAPLLAEKRLHTYRGAGKGQPELGKGYEEFRLLDGMVDELKEKGYERMVKVTGRYIVRNIQKLIPQKEEGPFIDLHPRIKSGIALSSFFVCPLDYYQEYIRGAYREVNEGERITIEKLLFQRLDALGKERPSLLLHEPIFEGTSGTWGTPIGRNPYRLKARELFRRLLRSGGWKRIPYEL